MTSAGGPRLAAIDALRRGVLSVRANWELIFAQWLGVVAVALLFLAGLLPLVIALGLSLADVGAAVSADPATVTSAMDRLRESFGAWNRPAVWLGLVATLLVWTAATVVQCFVTGGVYGILATADRQAPAGTPRGGAWFRTFTWSDFAGWGGRLLGRYFGFLNLFLLLLSFWGLAFALLLVFAVGAGQAWGAVAGFGVGCGGALPLIFVFLVTLLWFQLANAELADPEVRFGTGLRRALAVLGRRLGGVLLLMLLAIGASLAASALFLPFSLVGSAMAGDSIGAIWLLEGPLTILQWLVSSVVQLALAASLIALVRSERTAGR